MAIKRSSFFGVFVFLVGVAVSPVELSAQVSEAEQAVVAVGNILFDGMESGDADMIRSAFAPGARLAVIAADSVRYIDASDWAGSIAGMEESLDERAWDWQIDIDGQLASVWAKYDILVDGEFSHCGIDAFQLLLLNGEWKIVHVADTRHTGPDCWRRPEN